jgi:hypothetical protein
MHSVFNVDRHGVDGGNDGDGCSSGCPLPSDARLCIVCEREIPAARLRAMPTASKCVQCVQDSGDVPRLRRHDQLIGTLETGEVVSTYFKGEPNPYLQQVIKQQKMIRRFENSDNN